MHIIYSSTRPGRLYSCHAARGAVTYSLNETVPPGCCKSPTSKTEESKKIFCLGLPFGEVRNLSGGRG